MCKVAEAAYDCDVLADQPHGDADATISYVAERLSILSYQDIAAPSTELAKLSQMLRALVTAPTCRWCGRAIDTRKSYWGLGAVFCSPTCRDEALTPLPDDHDA